MFAHTFMWSSKLMDSHTILKLIAVKLLLTSQVYPVEVCKWQYKKQADPYWMDPQTMNHHRMAKVKAVNNNVRVLPCVYALGSNGILPQRRSELNE